MASVPMSDEVLAQQAKEGDTHAFEKIFDRYKKPILNFIYRFIGNRETAEEVAQEVFMKAYNNLAIFDVNKRFSTWLYTIARNLAKNSLRDKKYFRDVSLDAPVSGEAEEIRLKDVIADPSIGPAEIAQDEELAAEAQKVLDSMPQKYREIITLCSVQGLSYEEAAPILGISVASISIRLHEAKELFMKKLDMTPEKNKGSDTP